MAGGPVTEFAVLPLASGVDVAQGSDDLKVLREGLNVLLSQPGCNRVYYGHRVEDKSILDMIIDWDSHDAHMTFTKDESYQPFVKGLGAILGGAPALHHITFDPPAPRSALSDTSSPATEVLSQYFAPTLSEADKDKLTKSVGQTLENIKKGTPSLRAYVMGWLYEDSVPYEKGPGGKATVLRTVIGWDSVQAHLDARETQVFKDNVSGVREAPGLLGMDVYHVNATEVQQGGA